MDDFNSGPPIYAHRDAEDGPLEIIPPQKLLWYCFYVRNFYIYKDDKLQKALQRFRLPYKQYIELLDQVKSNNLFERWCGYRNNKKTVSLVELLVLGSL